jgi:F0F1-type ATP synthase assembly protein I
MLGIILLFVWGGSKLDEKYREGEPLFIIIFSLLGVFIALYTALRDFIKIKR